jgi:hypothetical protein
LQLALVVQQTQSEANDPIPEEDGISIRIVSFGCASSAQEGRPLRASMIALVIPGMLAPFESRRM